MLRNRKAQAVLELAILGSLIITAFAILISYSEKYNREQSYMQQTFRAALKKAQNINNSANWATVDFRRMPNVTNPMEIGALQQFSSSNNVLWSDGKKLAGKETEPKSYFQLNRTSIVQIPASAGLYNTTEVISTDYVSNLNSGTDFNKTESSNITTNKSLSATDTITGSSDVGGTTVSLGSSLGPGGKYTGGGLSNSRSMH